MMQKEPCPIKWSRISVLAIVFMLMVSGAAKAYEDEIAVRQSEIAGAVRELLGSAGYTEIKKDEEFASDWIVEKVMRKNRFFGRQSYLRRTRYKIFLTGWPTYTQVRISANFEFKKDSGVQGTPWRKLKPRYEDTSQEKELFLEIIRQLEAKRK